MKSINSKALRSMVEGYFSYVSLDSSLSPDERRKAVSDGTILFVELGRADNDGPIINYVLDQQQRLTEDSRYKTPQSREATYQPAKADSKNPKRGNSKVAKDTVPLVDEDRPLTLPDGFRSIEQVMRELKVDKRTLASILEQTNFKIDKFNLKWREVDAVSAQVYQDIRRYVKRARSA